MSKYFLPLLSKSDSGLVINVVSQAGMYSKANRAAYGASKWGMTGFTKYLCEEVLPENIRVTGIYPGKMNTALFEGAKIKKDMSDALEPELVSKAIKFIVDQPSCVHIPELGIKCTKQLR
jgi:NADP-dependent 3-hydroxy acid dehydrogenase YdfG